MRRPHRLWWLALHDRGRPCTVLCANIWRNSSDGPRYPQPAAEPCGNGMSTERCRLCVQLRGGHRLQVGVGGGFRRRSPAECRARMRLARPRIRTLWTTPPSLDGWKCTVACDLCTRLHCSRARAAYFGASRVVDPRPDVDVDAFVVNAAVKIRPRRGRGRGRRGRRRRRRGWRSGRRRRCRPPWADSDLHRKAQACTRPHAGRRQVVIDHHRRVVAGLEQRVVSGARPDNRASDISPIRSCIQHCTRIRIAGGGGWGSGHRVILQFGAQIGAHEGEVLFTQPVKRSDSLGVRRLCQ